MRRLIHLCASLSSPHTGWQDYQDGVKRIPSACITMEDAELMWRMAQRGERIVVRLTMGAKTLPDADSFNTVAEITGWQHPEQVDLILPSQTLACLTYLSKYLVMQESLFSSLFFGWAFQIDWMGNRCPEENSYYNVLVSLLMSLSLSFPRCSGTRKEWCNLFLPTPDIPTAFSLPLLWRCVCDLIFPEKHRGSA